MATASTGVLLVHDGELTDVRSLLSSLKVPFSETLGAATSEDQHSAWKLIIGTPKHILTMQIGARGVKPTRIVLINDDSRTLLAMLRRSGVDLMVQRPVHPAALRLLLLHALYQGPEKRRRARITIGAPINYRAGLRRRNAMLVDLSLRGCRLLSSPSARCHKRNARIKIQLPIALGCEKAIHIDGRVIRSGPTEMNGERLDTIAVRFDTVTAKSARSLKEILDTHRSGPAIVEDGDGSQPAASSPETEATPAPQASPRATEGASLPAPPPVSQPSPLPPSAPRPLPPSAAPPSGEYGARDRRTAPRHTIDRRVIALGVEATRVLIGRDVTASGMRVEPNDSIDVRDSLLIALHIEERQEPLVVNAIVDRDDGDDGLFLRFSVLPELERAQLEKMVRQLPIVAARGGDEGSGVIVSEILERTDTDSETDTP